MARVDADPESLRQFAKQLRRTEESVKQQLRQLTSQLNGLDWNDDQRQRFESELTQMTKQIERFASNISSTYAPSLEKKARALDEYRRH